jgi:DHA2 family multidrug resistance protein
VAGAAGAPAQEAPSDKALLPTPNHPLCVIGLMLATILPLLDTTIANVALPHMQAQLNATPETVVWVLTSYIIAHAVAMPATGWLADRIGSRQLFIGSTIGFIITSMLCGLAQNLEQMVLFRTLQGISASFVMPLSQSLMLDITKPSRHTSMMTIWGLGAVLGPIMGPLAGGWITENWNWRWAFLVNVPLGFIAVALLYFTLPGHPKRKRQFDLRGFVLLALSMSSMQLLLDRGPHVDWFDATESWLYLLVAISTFWMAMIHLMTSSNPIYDRGLFKDINFVIAFVFMILVGMVIYATAALLAPMLQVLFHFTAYDTGVVIAPRGIGAMIAMNIVGQMQKRGWDPRIPITMGFGCVIWSLYAMASWSLETDLPQFLWTGVIQGFGVGFITMPIYVIAFATLAPRLRTDASGLLNLSRLVGSSVSISVMTAFYANSVQTTHQELGSHFDGSDLSAINAATAGLFREFSDSALRLVDAEINRQAAMVAYINDFWLIMWGAIIVMPLILLVRRPQPAKPPQSP